MDDPRAREVFGSQLEATGFEVEIATDRNEAERKLHTCKPDVTFLLFTQPGREATEFIKKIRQDPQFETHLICVCTLSASLPTSTGRGANGDPTKFYNLLSTSIHTALADITDHLLPDDHSGAGTSANPLSTQVAMTYAARLAGEIAGLRADLELLQNSEDDKNRAEQCTQSREKCHSLVICAAVAGMGVVARYAAAIASLLEELSGQPGLLTPACLQTLMSAMEMLDALARSACDCGENAFPNLTAVVLADANDGRLALTGSLLKAGFQPASFSDPDSATANLEKNDADLVVVHLHTPEPDIVALCERIRSLTIGRGTLVIVAGSSSQLKNPGQILSAGAGAVLLHPFALMELALKGLTLVQQHRAESQHVTNPAALWVEDPMAGESQIGEQGSANPMHTPGRQQTNRKDCLMNISSEALKSVDHTLAEAVSADNDEGQAMRCHELEEELAAISRLYIQLQEKFAAEQQVALGSRQSAAEMETQLQEQRTELERTKMEMEQFAAERAMIQAEKEKLVEAKGELENQLARIQDAPAAPRAEVPQESVATADSRFRAGAELEYERAEKRRIQQRVAALAKDLEELHARTSAYFESERLNQARVSALEQQLAERDAALARARADMHKEMTERGSAEEQLRAAEALIAEFRNGNTAFVSAKGALLRRQEEMEARLQSSMALASETESKLQAEKRGRERIEQTLAAVQRLAEDQKGQISELKCELELEQADKKRLEGEAVQSRYASADLARASLTALNELCRETREPLNSLLEATRRLLELELDPEAKKHIDCVLVNGLSLQTQIKEFTPSPVPTAEVSS